MKRIIQLIIVLLSINTSVKADILVSNLSGTGSGDATAQNTFWYAQKFTTDNNTYEVNSLSFIGGRHPATSAILVYIYNHEPGNDVPVAGASGFGQFDATAVTTTSELQALPSIGTINLNANTSYWIVIQPDNVNGAFWRQVTETGNISGLGTIDNRRATSNNGGTSWSGQTPATNLTIQLDTTTTPVELQSFEIE